MNVVIEVHIHLFLLKETYSQASVIMEMHNQTFLLMELYIQMFLLIEIHSQMSLLKKINCQMALLVNCHNYLLKKANSNITVRTQIKTSSTYMYINRQTVQLENQRHPYLKQRKVGAFTTCTLACMITDILTN